MPADRTHRLTTTRRRLLAVGAAAAAASPLGFNIVGHAKAATGKVTLPARLHAVPAPAKDAVRALVVTGGHSYPTDFYTLFEGQSDLLWSHAKIGRAHV